MASITITVNDNKVPLIQATLAQYNADHGTSLTMAQWVKTLVAREVLRGEMSDAAFAVRRQKDEEARAAVQAAEDAVLGAL